MQGIASVYLQIPSDTFRYLLFLQQLNFCHSRVYRGRPVCSFPLANVWRRVGSPGSDVLRHITWGTLAHSHDMSHFGMSNQSLSFALLIVVHSLESHMPWKDITWHFSLKLKHLKYTYDFSMFLTSFNFILLEVTTWSLERAKTEANPTTHARITCPSTSAMLCWEMVC